MAFVTISSLKGHVLTTGVIKLHGSALRWKIIDITHPTGLFESNPSQFSFSPYLGNAAFVICAKSVFVQG